MRDLTTCELEAQVAEQLPARELMGRPPKGSHSGTSQSQSANVGSGNGNYNGNTAGGNGIANLTISALNGNANGLFNGNGSGVEQLQFS
jgi:hypothetical protein